MGKNYKSSFVDCWKNFQVHGGFYYEKKKFLKCPNLSMVHLWIFLISPEIEESATVMRNETITGYPSNMALVFRMLFPIDKVVFFLLIFCWSKRGVEDGFQFSTYNASRSNGTCNFFPSTARWQSAATWRETRRAIERESERARARDENREFRGQLFCPLEQRAEN